MVLEIDGKSFFGIVERHTLVDVLLNVSTLKGRQETFFLDAFGKGPDLQVALFHGIGLELLSQFMLGEMSKGKPAFPTCVLRPSGVIMVRFRLC